MSEENTTPELPSTPTGDSYDSSISNAPTGGGEAGEETEESPSLFDINSTAFMEQGPASFATGIVDKGSVTGETLKDLTGYTTRFTDLDQAFTDAAINQGVFAALGNGAVKAATEVVGGTIEGFGAIAALFDKERMHHQNFLEQLGRGIRESTDDFDIWERNRGATFAFSDAAWWAKNMPSMASSLSMMVPAAAVARGVSVIGKAIRSMGKAANIARGAKAARTGAIVEGVVGDIAGGATMRHTENMREAHGVFEDARAEFLSNPMPLETFEGSDAWQAFYQEHNRIPMNKHELADYIGGSAAKHSYKVNSINLLSDIAQFSAFGRMFKATRGAAKASTKAKALGKEMSRSEKWGQRLKKGGKFLFRDMGSEGLEEMVNHIGTEEALHHALRIADMGEESSIDERLRMYANDNHMWEAAFFGAIGGGLFTAARPMMDKVSGRGTKQQERILEQARHRQEVLHKASELAKQAENGEISADEARAKTASMQMEQAFTAAQSGTADVFEAQVQQAAQQMEEAGVSKEQRDQFVEDSMSALEIAEKAATEAKLITDGLSDLSPEARAILTHSLAQNAHNKFLNERLQTSLRARIGNDKDFEGKRAYQIREGVEDMKTLIKAAEEAGDTELVENYKQSLEVLNELAAALPTEEMVVDEARVAKHEAKLKELKSKDRTSMEPAAQTAYDLEVSMTEEALANAKKGEVKDYKNEDQNVTELIGAEIESVLMDKEKQQMLSAEGLSALRKNAELVKQEMDKRDKADRDKGQEERSDDELRAEQKRLDQNNADEKARYDEIEAVLEQRKLDRIAKEASKNEQRSKDIQVSPAAQAAIDKMIADTENLELSEDEKYYVDKRTGKKYMRTTTFIHKGKSKNIRRHWSVPSTNIGNSIDLFVRDFFDGNIGQNEYPHLPEELRPALIKQLEELEARFVAAGEKVVPHDVTLMADTETATALDPETAGVAGTVDLITVDKNGNLRVYDMKTVREAVVSKKVYKDDEWTGQFGPKIISDPAFEGEFSLWGKRADKEMTDGYQRQVSTYAIMATLSTGLPVVDAAIIPIDVRYNSSEQLTEEELQTIQADQADLLAPIQQTLIPNVNGLEVSKEQTSEDHPADDGVSEDSTPPDHTQDPEGPNAGEGKKPESLEEEIDLISGIVKDLKAQRARRQARLDKVQAEENMVTPDGPVRGTEELILEMQIAQLDTQISLQEDYLKELGQKLDLMYADQGQNDDPVITPDEDTQDNPDVDSPVVDTPVEAAPFTVPMTNLVRAFANQLQVTTEFSREHMLVHGHKGVLQLSDSATEAQYLALQRALEPNSAAVVKFEVREQRLTRKPVEFKSAYKKGSTVKTIASLDGVSKVEGEKIKYTYAPQLSDTLEIVVTIDGVEMGALPTVGELLEAGSKRFDSVSTSARIAAETFGTNSRTGDPIVNENLIMSEQSQEAHLENAIAINKLRNAILKVQGEQGGAVTVRAEVTAGETTMGLTAVGSLIQDTSMQLTAEALGVADYITQRGVALVLPGMSAGTQVAQLSGPEKQNVTPYGQNEAEGTSSTAMKRYSSGSLFVPIQQPGHPLPMWVKVPGQTISQLVNADKITQALANLLLSGDTTSIALAQNILGSNALTQKVDEQGNPIEGAWVILPTNQNGLIIAGVPPLSEMINGVWTNDPTAIIPNMAVDIAVQTAAGPAASAYRTNGEFDLDPTDREATLLYQNLGEFVAKEMRLGYAPVAGRNGDILGWTHPMAPAYNRNNSNPGNAEEFKGKVLYNENANKTQVRVGMTPIAIEGVSGADLMAKMTEEEAGTVKKDAAKKQAKEEVKKAKTPEKKKAAKKKAEQLDLFGPPTPSSNESGKVETSTELDKERAKLEDLIAQRTELFKELPGRFESFPSMSIRQKYEAREEALQKKIAAAEARILKLEKAKEADAKKAAMEWGLTPEQQALKEKVEAAKKRRRWMDVAGQEAAKNAEKNTEIDMKVAEEWWAENMPGVPFKRVSGMIKRNGKVGYGIFEEGAVIVSDLGVKGIEFHEAFHAVFDMYLTPARKAKVLADAKRMYGENLTEEKLEEELAEAFREYMLTDGLSNREKSVVRRFFSELYELIRAMIADGFSGARKIYLAQQINRGKFSGDARTKGTAQRWMKADLPVWATNQQHREELNGVMKRYAFEAWRDREVYGNGEGLMRILNSSERDSQENLGVEKLEAAARELLTMAFNGSLAFGFSDARANMDPTSAAYENSGKLMTEEREQVIEALAKDKKFQNWVKDLTSGNETAGTDTTSQYNDEAFAKMNPKDSLSANVRNLIETTPQVTTATLRNSPRLKALLAEVEILTQNAVTAKAQKNDTQYEQLLDQINEKSVQVSDLIGSTPTSSIFGLPRNMDLDLNFPYMSRELSTVNSPQEMINRLFEMGQAYPEFKMLAIRLANEDATLQGQFFNGFKRTTSEQVLIKKGRTVTSVPFTETLAFQNRSDIARALADVNISELTSKLEKLKSMLKGLDPTVQVEQTIKALKMMGFNTIDRTALPVVVQNMANSPAGVEALTGLVGAAISAARSYDAMKTAEKEEDYNNAEKGFANNVQKLANLFAPMDRGAVQTQLEDAAGTRVQAKQVPSYIGRWFDNLNKRSGESNETYEQRIRDLFADPRTRNTTHYNLLFDRKGNFRGESVARGLKTYRLGGFVKGDGIDYTNMNGRHHMAFRFNAMAGVFAREDGKYKTMFPITTPSDAGGTYLVEGEMFDISTPAGKTKTLMRLEGIVESELMWMQAEGKTGRFSNPAVHNFMVKHYPSEGGDFISITTNAKQPEIIKRAAEILLEELVKEGEVLREHEDFTGAIDDGLIHGRNLPQDRFYNMPTIMAISSYISNWSHATMLAGTHNEFKQNLAKNTTDMQKRHKHVVSPTITPSGITNNKLGPKFRSVTMKDVKFDLTGTGVNGTSDLFHSQYKGVEVADAQTYVTPDMYERVLLESGDWDPTYGEAFEILRQGGKLPADLHNKLMRPFKPFYYHRWMNEATGLLESSQIKNSIIPLIPGISPEMDKLKDWMDDNGIHQVQMGTAHKVGNNKGEATLINNNGEFSVENFSQDMVHELDFEGYGKQVHNPDHWHNNSTNTLMSQMQRISAAAAVSFMGDEGIQIAREFNATLDQVFKEQFDKFNEQFQDGDGKFTPVLFKQWLLNELADTDLPLSTIELINDGMFTAPQVAPLVRSRVYSAVENAGKTVKVIGGTAVQISSQLVRTRDKRLKGQRLGKSGAKTVTKTVKGEVTNEAFLNDLMSVVEPGEFVVFDDVFGKNPRPLTVEHLALGWRDKTLTVEMNYKNGKGQEMQDQMGIEGVIDELWSRVMDRHFKNNPDLQKSRLAVQGFDGLMRELRESDELAKDDPDFKEEPGVIALRSYVEELGGDQEVTAEEGGEETVLPAEVIVSRDFLPKKYQNKEKYPTVESIRAEAPEVLELFTVRIPSESPNSGSLCTVVDFLPDGMDGVVVPDEFVTQMGSDFDVDKLFFIWKDHTGKNELMNKLYDGMTAPFRDKRVLKAIQAPQGFDTLSALAEDKGLRKNMKFGETGVDDHVNGNPYSLLTHHVLTADNMAGVALKGQAANKNLILLDNIVNQMVMDSEFTFGAAVPAQFSWKPSAALEALKGLHSEMVAAAMDGAKDPVYGKLGVTAENYNLFATIIATGGGIPSYEKRTDEKTGETFDIPGAISFAVEVIQSEAGRMLTEGHIRIKAKGKMTMVTGVTGKGRKFVKQIAEEAKQSMDGDVVMLPGVPQFNPRRQKDWQMTSAIGQFVAQIVEPLKEQGDAMRVDRKSIRRGIDEAASKTVSQHGTFHLTTNDKTYITRLDYLDGQVDNPFKLPVKGTVRGMFDATIDMLKKVGDNYLHLRQMNGEAQTVKALTEGAYDAYIASRAALKMGAEAEVYRAMGERDSRAVETLPEDSTNYSLEQWERKLKRDDEVMADEDMSLVLSKILVQPQPYQFSDGKYADNLTLTGISDNMELLKVQQAVQRIYDKGGDGKLFIEAMTAYEAQRSRFNTSQSRFTSILPAQVHADIAKAAEISALGDSGVHEAGLNNGQDVLAAVLQNQIYNASKLPFGGEFDTHAEALNAAEDYPAGGPRRVTIGKDKPQMFVVLPWAETEEGAEYFIVKPTSVSPNGKVQNFAGREMKAYRDSIQVDRSAFATAVAKAEEQGGKVPEWVTDMDLLNAYMRGEITSDPKNKSVDQSRLSYGRARSTEEKIAILKNRFAKAGVPVRVEQDSDLGANAEVRIENGSAVITINPNLLQGDTIAHEFGHILIEGLGYNHPVVQQLIAELRDSEVWQEVASAYGDIRDNTEKFEKEVVVTALGRAASKQMEQGKLRTLINKLFRAIGKLFGIKPKATQQLVDMLLEEGPIPSFSLEGVATTEEQRGKKTGTEVTKEFEKKWGALSKQLQTRKFTNTEFEVAATRLTREQIRVTKAKTIGRKLDLIGEAAQAELRSAAGITARLAQMAEVGFRGTKMKAEEANLLANVHTTLQSLETLRDVLTGMDPEGADANSQIREQYLALQEELDRLMRAETILKETLAGIISQQLASISVDKDIRKFVEEEGNLIFDMINDPVLRERMTDVTAMEKGTLGISEFKNPVIQLIAKQVATAVEAGRLEGRSAEMRVSDILKEAETKGVTIDQLIDKGTGKFITETSEDWAVGNRKARIALASGNEGEYIKFHAANSENQFSKEYMQTYMFNTMNMRKKLIEIQELRDAKKTFGMNSLDGAIEQAEAELHVFLTNSKENIKKYHDIVVKDTFEAARAKEAEKGEEALQKFDNEHGVVDGMPINPNSRFVTMTVKPEHKNENYTGKDGQPVPNAKNRNSAYAKLPDAAKETLAKLRTEIENAMGADSKFLEEGSVPYYSVIDKPKDWRQKIKEAKAVADKTVKSVEQEELAERVLEDASGRAIYTRQRKVFAASPDQVANFKSLSDLSKHLGEAVKDAHKESAKATMEPFAYLSRDVFDSTEVIDGKHVILVGKKGDRSRRLRSREVAGTNISVALDQWLEGMLGENWEDASKYDGAVAAFQTYTSTMGLAINPLAWFNNFAYGNVQRWLEVRNNEFYDKKHAKRARSVIGSDIMGITNDIVSGKRSGYSSPVSALINLLDIADDQREMPFGKRETSYSKMVNALFVGQTMGEVIMQNHTAFAIMMDTKVVLADGTETNLYDAMTGTFNSEAGTVGLPEGATVEYQGKMVPLDSNYLALFRNRAKAINHYIHGAYNKQDAGTWQREFWGRALMQFRRWLPMNLKKRFGSKQTNERRERVEQGWYRSMMEFLGIVINNAKNFGEMKNAIQAMKEESPAVYRGAMNGLIEVGSGLAMFMLLALIYAALDPEDEEDYFTAIALNRSQRLMQEMNTYTPWGLLDTFGSFSENPFAAMTRVEGLGSILSQSIEDTAGFVFKGEGFERYESGMRKGQAKLGVAIGKATPVLSHGMRLWHVADVQKQFSAAKNLADWFEK